MTALPSGIVTFLFVDIEGSTRLMHRLGDRYPAALDRYRGHIESAARDHDGHVVSHLGDGAFLAFASPEEAIDAAIATQELLADEHWPDGVTLLARAGIHSGLASPRHGDYVAVAVHQASRVMGAAHGGQVLVSDATADLLPSRPDLEPLGRFRLRDFEQPVGLRRVRWRGDRPDRGVRAIPADRHNFVEPPTTTIGRDREIAGVAHNLHRGALLTLVGPGGVGKTRIATEAGIVAADRWEGGVWNVDLADVDSSDAVAAATASAIGAPRLGDDPMVDILEHLSSRSAVVVLDNCEHVIHGARRMAREIAAAAGGVAMLATSREPLGLPGERVERVAPLDLPERPDPDAVMASAAGQMLVDRIGDADPLFALDEITAPAVAELAAAVDGLPLLIELAAAQAGYRSPAEIVQGIRDGLLEGRSSAQPERHRTADAVLRWSYDLLGDVEAGAFRALGVFSSSFSIDYAGIAVGDASEAARAVWSLVDRSLLQLDRSANETRYRMLGTIRAFALGQQPDDREVVAFRLARAYVDSLGPSLLRDHRWLGGVGQELENIRSVISLLPEEEQETAQELAVVDARYLDATHAYRLGVEEASRWLARLPAELPTRVSLLCAAADLALRLDDIEQATRLVDEADNLRESVGAPEWDDVAVERTRGEIARRAGDLEAAAAIARETLDRDITDRGRRRMYNLLGSTAAAMGDLPAALEACRRELELGRSSATDAYVALAHGNIAEVALRLGDLALAARNQLACIDLATEMGLMGDVAFSLIGTARIAAADSDWRTVVRLHARAEQILDELGLVLYQDDAEESARALGEAMSALGRSEFRRLEESGRTLGLGEAIDLARNVLAGHADSDPKP